MLLWILCLVLLIAVLALWGKVRLLQRSMDEIAEDLADRLSTDTNVLLSISSRDQHARRLAADLNRQLQLLREQRRRYLSGDLELKEAVTNISHDLRTPLTAIRGYLELLEGEEKSADAERYLALIGDRAEAMTKLTEELFRYSVILCTEAFKPEPVDLAAALAESLADFYGSLKEKHIDPVVDLPDEPVVRHLDRGALARIFGNILSNAVKYSGGDLEIALQPSGEVCFVNSASGLDEVQIGRLFDRFFTVEAARNSTGLGLAISKTLVERMGGTIAAEYATGQLAICVTFRT